jgi:FtsP/CotA-like multicopper oxidase with cupredoxin domain
MGLVVIAILGSLVPAAAQRIKVEKVSTQYSVFPNDNTRPAGRLKEKVLTVRLFAGIGSAQPAGPQSVPIEVAAFGEEGAELSAPGPFIRVHEGTTVVLTLRNTLGVVLLAHGLCARPGPCDAVSIAPETSQEIRFDLNAPGCPSSEILGQEAS